MSKNKTLPTDVNAHDFLKTIAHKTRQADSFALLDIYEHITGEPPVMWGESIIGFGKYHYKYDSGREGDSLKAGFSPRKTNIAIYLMRGVRKHQTLLRELGPYKHGVSCLYITQLAKINFDILKNIIKNDFEKMTEIYG